MSSVSTKPFELYAVFVKQTNDTTSVTHSRWNVFSDRKRTNKVGIYLVNTKTTKTGNNLLLYHQASLQVNFGYFSTSYYSKIKDLIVLPFSAPLFGATPSNINSTGNFTGTIIGVDKKTDSPIMSLVGTINKNV